MSKDLDTNDLKEDLKARHAEAKLRRSLLEQVRQNWLLLAFLGGSALSAWTSYSGLRDAVRDATKSIAILTSRVEELSTSERRVDGRVIALEVGQRDLDRRVQTIEGWLRQTAATPAGRRLDMPAPPAKE